MLSVSWHLSSNAIRSRLTASRAFSCTAACQRDDYQLKDIIPGDLTATLAAHRRSNRQPFRRVTSNNEEPIAEVAAPDNFAESDVSGITPAGSPEGEEDDTTAADEGNTKPNHIQGDVVRYHMPTVPGREARSIESKIRTLRRANMKKEDLAAAMRHVKASDVKSKISRRNALSRKTDMQKYKAQYQEVVKSSGDYREPYRPWHVDAQAVIGMSREALLGEQMVKLANWLTLTPEEHAFRNDLALDFTSKLREQLVDIDFWLFGSHQTGLATTMSDIDVGFFLPSMQKKPGDRGPSVSLGRRPNRRIIHRTLKRINISSIWTKRFDDHEVVQAKYPLVRMRHLGSDTDIQIVASQPTKIVSEYIRDSLAEYPQLKPAFFLLKAILAARRLDEPYDGGLGSYTLLILIIAVFKRRSIARRTSLVTALRAVLKIFDKTSPMYHNLRHDGMMTVAPYTFSKRLPTETLSNKDKAIIESDSAAWARHQISAVRDGQDRLLCLQDPNDPLNDLGRGSYQMLNVQATFFHLNLKLHQWTNGETIVDDEGQPSELLDWLIGDICNVVQDRRTAFAKWQASFHGKSELEQMQQRLENLKESDGLTSGGPRSLAAVSIDQDLDKAVDTLLGEDFGREAKESESDGNT
jgi:DNA polymerase sigma